MSEYNASDTRSIRRATKAAKQAEVERQGVILQLMSNPAGRNYIYDQLVTCHVFSSSFSNSSLGMAFAEGERNIGLQVLAEVMLHAPEQYIQMVREANDRRIASSSPTRNGRANGRGDDSGPIALDDDSGTVVSEYEPGDDATSEG